jgi:predicted dehydrogenase
MRQIPLEGPPMPGNFTNQLEAFAECVRNGTDPEATGEDGLRSLAVVLAAYRSSEEKRFVSPGEML